MSTREGEAGDRARTKVDDVAEGGALSAMNAAEHRAGTPSTDLLAHHGVFRSRSNAVVGASAREPASLSTTVRSRAQSRSPEHPGVPHSETATSTTTSQQKNREPDVVPQSLNPVANPSDVSAPITGFKDCAQSIVDSELVPVVMAIESPSRNRLGHRNSFSGVSPNPQAAALVGVQVSHRPPPPAASRVSHPNSTAGLPGHAATTTAAAAGAAGSELNEDVPIFKLAQAVRDLASPTQLPLSSATLAADQHGFILPSLRRRERGATAPAESGLRGMAAQTALSGAGASFGAARPRSGSVSSTQSADRAAFSAAAEPVKPRLESTTPSAATSWTAGGSDQAAALSVRQAVHCLLAPTCACLKEVSRFRFVGRPG